MIRVWGLGSPEIVTYRGLCGFSKLTWDSFGSVDKCPILVGLGTVFGNFLKLLLISAVSVAFGNNEPPKVPAVHRQRISSRLRMRHTRSQYNPKIVTNPNVEYISMLIKL